MKFRPRAMRSLVPLGVTATLVLGACGGDDDDDTDPRTDQTIVEATEPAVESTEGTSETTEAAATTERATTEPATTEPATTEPATTEAAAAGFTYTSPEGDYSAVFPSEPSSETQSAALPDGNTIDLVITGVEDEGNHYVATARGQYPDGYVLDVPLALQGAQDQAIANLSGTLIASRDVTLQGRPGREFSASVSSNGVPGTVLQQVYLDGLVIYQVIAAGPGELTFQDPDLAPFFASFAFTTG